MCSSAGRRVCATALAQSSFHFELTSPSDYLLSLRELQACATQSYKAMAPLGRCCTRQGAVHCRPLYMQRCPCIATPLQLLNYHECFLACVPSGAQPCKARLRGPLQGSHPPPAIARVALVPVIGFAAIHVCLNFNQGAIYRYAPVGLGVRKWQ